MAGVRDLVRTAAAPGVAATRAAARLMTLVADDPARLPDVYQATAALEGPESGRLLLPRLLVGVTGAPGSGKSTLTDALVRHYRQRFPARRIGVVAVDPSSPFTGGAVLGDRVRMMRHATDPLVFVRSMASRGHLGGLALGVKGVIRIMGLVGCDLVFVETVGVGQSEVEIAAVADLVMIVMAPGQGDGVQLLKAGLMEIGDLFVVNKADRPDAGRLHSELLAMLRIAHDDAGGHHAPGPAPLAAGLPSHGGDGDGDGSGPLLSRRPGTRVEPRTFLASAERGDGVSTLADALEDLAGQHADHWQSQRRLAVEDEIREAVLEEAARRVRRAFRVPAPGADPVRDILEARLSVVEAARQLLRESLADD
jgi:LAO/AO transport system kinase